MSTYTPGLYRTVGGKIFLYSGKVWTPFTKDWSYLDEEFETNDQPEPEMIKLGTESEKLALIKEWWSKASRSDNADWAMMIDLAEILMKEN